MSIGSHDRCSNFIRPTHDGTLAPVCILENWIFSSLGWTVLAYSIPRRTSEDHVQKTLCKSLQEQIHVHSEYLIATEFDIQVD